MKPAIFFFRVCAIFLTALGSAVSMGSENSNPAQISIDDPRPVAAAAQKLGAQYGYVVTYEDPRYQSLDDMMDQETGTTPQASIPGRNHKNLAPRNRHLSVTIESPSGLSGPDALGYALDALLKANDALNAGGQFALKREGKVFHIVPSQIRNAHGEWISASSLLDTQISMPQKTRNGMDTLEAFCQAVTLKTGTPVWLGAAPANTVGRWRGTFGANDESADSVLLRFLSSMNSDLSWGLFYDPGLEIYLLTVERADMRPAS
jgi:hypothetical protein